MITIISGTPGSGKTAMIIEMIMEELKKGRKVYTFGIPDLLLQVQTAGDPQRWHDGSWLKLDKYAPDLCEKLGLQSAWLPDVVNDVPDEIKGDQHEALQWVKNNRKRPADSGALIIVDEAHIKFPQRASGKAPPAYIEALNVHRHQGLDFWFVTQRPAFLDPFIRGLCSRHLHLALNPFSFNGARQKLEWAEYQESVNRTSKLSAAKTKYRPASHVFPLYASASVHTKLKHSMPSIMKGFIFALVLLAVLVYFAVQRVQSRFSPSSAPVPQLTKKDDAGGGAQRSGAAVAAAALPASSVPVVSNNPVVFDNSPHFPTVDSCLATASDCRCYYDHRRIPIDPMLCREILSGNWVSSRPATSLSGLTNASL